MDLESFLKKSTPNLASDVLQTVLQRLTVIGVDSVNDLALVQETDLSEVLPPIKVRRLLQNWSCPG